MIAEGVEPVGGWALCLCDAMQEQGGPMGLRETNRRVVEQFRSLGEARRRVETLAQNARLHPILEEIAEQAWIAGRRFDTSGVVDIAMPGAPESLFPAISGIAIAPVA